MRNSLLYSLLAICAVLGQKLAVGDESLHKSPVGVLSKIDVKVTAQAPMVVTGEAAFDYSRYILTMSGTVNAQGLTTTVWFQYGTMSGSYSDISVTQSVNGSSDTSVEISVNIISIPPNESGVTYYYYRVVAENELGTSYGEEKSLGLVTPIPDCLCGVSGRVIDAVSKQGVMNAAVCSYEGSISYTNKLGYYVWDNGVIPCTSGSTYNLTASADGYEPLMQYIDIQPCVENTLNFELQSAGKPTPTSTAILTPIPTIIPTPIYEGVKMSISQRVLRLKCGQSGVITVTLEGDNGVLEGKTVIGTTGKSGSRRILILPASGVTDGHGQAQFAINAKDKTGNARATFKADNLKKSIIIKVRK